MIEGTKLWFGFVPFWLSRVLGLDTDPEDIFRQSVPLYGVIGAPSRYMSISRLCVATSSSGEGGVRWL